MTNGLLNIELENICDFSNIFPLITAEGKRLKFRKPIETPTDDPILSPIFFEVSYNRSYRSTMYFGNWKGWLIKGLAILTIFLAVTAWQGRNLISKQTPAPSFRLPALSGPTVALEDLRGRRVLLYFFAPWCKVCDLSISNLNWVRRLWDEKSVSIFAVALSYEELQSVEAFLERNALDVPVLLGTRELLNSYRISAFPTVYVLNESGNIDGSAVGYSSTLGLLWRTL